MSIIATLNIQQLQELIHRGVRACANDQTLMDLCLSTKGNIPTTARRKIEKKTTSQSPAKAPSYMMGAVGLSISPLPVNIGNTGRGNKQTKKATHAPMTKVNK